MSSSSSSHSKPVFNKNETINDNWQLIREIGCGGCGRVYEVVRLTGKGTGIRAAMKAETVDEKRKNTQTLLAEALVLRRMQWSPHFCRLYLAGRLLPSCNVVIMSLVGRPLSWFRRQNPNQRFTLSTALRLSLQCLAAIEHLHSVGFLHRDVKGSNFTIGCEKLSRVIHMIDFGFARLYLSMKADGEVELRKPRKRAPFLGTDRYCSIYVHKREEQGRRDDLWSFFYMLVEFIIGQLPWRSASFKRLLSEKMQCGDRLLKDCPHQLYAVYDHIKQLGFADRPDYGLIRRVISGICKEKHYNDESPFDWEEGGRFRNEYLKAIEELNRKNSESSTANAISDLSTAENSSKKNYYINGYEENMETKTGQMQEKTVQDCNHIPQNSLLAQSKERRYFRCEEESDWQISDVSTNISSKYN